LIKFIDAKTPLSIQVHPHDNIAKELHDSYGKNEMWYIIDADNNADIIVGFNRQLDKTSYSKYLENNNVLKVLNSVKTKTGDAFNIPTGRVHAIGAGVLLAEIQQTSDVTYRIYDYGRVDKTTGETRELHNDLALDVLDFDVQDTCKTDYLKESNVSNKLIHTAYFRTNFINLTKSIQKDYSETDSFVIYICTEGVLEITVNNVNYSLSKGESILIPANINQLKLTPQKKSKILEVYY
jgi:mannose-6-phosphate isomerase